MTDKLTKALASVTIIDRDDPMRATGNTRRVREAVRRWASFPTDEDVEAADAAYHDAIMEHPDLVRGLADVRRDAIRAALEAVKREDR